MNKVVFYIYYKFSLKKDEKIEHNKIIRKNIILYYLKKTTFAV